MSDGRRHSVDALCMACLGGDRRAVADALRAARSASAEAACELLDSVLLVHPSSRPAQRLKIELLLEAGHLDDADAWTARALLMWPVDPSLMLLRARAMAARHRWQEADAEVTAALRWRPHHRGAIRFAAQIASKLDDHHRAVELLQRMAEREPAGEAVPERLAESLLRAGDVVRAAAVAESIFPPNMPLLARVRRAEGRTLDAVELIESELATCHSEAEADRCLGFLIELLEEAGDVRRVREATQRAGPLHSVASYRAGLALLGAGDFTAAIRRLRALGRDKSCVRQALHALAVAAALAGRVRLARRALHRLCRTRDGIDRTTMIECWRRGQLGRLMREQQSPAAGRDPGSGLLSGLLQSAVTTFDRAGAGRPSPEFARHRAVCAAAIKHGCDQTLTASRAGLAEERARCGK